MILDLLNVRAWAMETTFFERAYPVALSLIAGGHDLSRLTGIAKEAALQPSVFYIEDPLVVNHPLKGVKTSSGDLVGYIKISGGITKTGGLCSLGAMHHIAQIEKANNHEDVKGIFIEMDTPGGSVDGTPELGTAIKNSKKPVVVFADNMVASAGYWAASQASEIIANENNYTEIGSIGTLFVYPQYANVISAGNFPNVRIIRAPQSTDKALLNAFEPMTKEKEKTVLDDLRQVTEDFINTVKAGRGARLNTGDENIFTGKMYDKHMALAMGMIDAIGSRQMAIDRAGGLAASSASPTDDDKTGPAASGKNANQLNLKFPKISSLFGQADAEVNEELSAENEAELLAAEQRLTEQELELEARANQIAELQAQVEAANGTIAENAQLIETQTARIAELEAELEAAPAGVATTVIAKADEFGDENYHPTSVDKLKAEINDL